MKSVIVFSAPPDICTVDTGRSAAGTEHRTRNPTITSSMRYRYTNIIRVPSLRLLLKEFWSQNIFILKFNIIALHPLIYNRREDIMLLVTPRVKCYLLFHVGIFLP